MHKVYLTFMSVLLYGCTLGPDYQRPATDVPPQWRLGTTEAGELSNIAWWDQFNDSALSRLLRTALENNNNLKVAAAQVDQAYAQYGITRAALFPEVNATANASRKRTSGTVVPFFPSSQNSSNYALGLGASYEIDFWGRLRRGTELARASLLASEEGRRTVVLTLATSVADAYIQLRALDKALEIAKRTYQERQEALRLQKRRFEVGVIPELDYSQAVSQSQVAAAAIPDLERQVAQQENLISVLLGANPEAIERGRTIDELNFPSVPSDLPSTVLERRPDIRQAEQNLIASNANIGFTKAKYFPQISLTAAFGLQSSQLSNLFKGASRTWTYGADVLQPLFNAGRIRSQVEEAEAVQRQALYGYRQSVISAFREVEDALIGAAKYKQQYAEQAANVAALRRNLELAEIRYKAGVTIYLEVVSAEQTLFDAELALLNTQARLFQAYVGLYKAMGGGWLVDAEKLATSPVNFKVISK
jgi:multidrug efflux system outer membrane protein